MFFIRLFHVCQLVLSWPYKSFNCKNSCWSLVLLKAIGMFFPPTAVKALSSLLRKRLFFNLRSMNSFLLAWFNALFYSRSYHPLPLLSFPLLLHFDAIVVFREVNQRLQTYIYVFTKIDMTNPPTSGIRESICQASHLSKISCIQDPKTSKQ